MANVPVPIPRETRAEYVALPVGNAGQGMSVTKLVAGCVAGDDAAKAAFVNEYADLIRRAIAGRLQELGADRPVFDDVEDMCNDLLERLLVDDCRRLASLKKPKSINAWLVSLSRHHVVDYLRKWSSRVRTRLALEREQQVGGIPEANPAQAAMKEEQVALVGALLESLPARDRLVLDLYYLHGLKYAEIAELTGQNINTVAGQLRRGKLRLREAMVKETDRMADTGVFPFNEGEKA